jgi:hypothetical protein
MPPHCLEDLLNDSAEFIRTRQGGLKKKYNTEKIWMYEIVWMNKNDPRIKSDDVEVLVNEEARYDVIARMRTRLAIKATRIAQTTPSGEIVDIKAVLDREPRIHKPRLANISSMERSYNKNRNWQ